MSADVSRIDLIATRHSRIKTPKKLLPLCGKWDGWPPLSAALRADNGWPHAVCTGVNTGLMEKLQTHITPDVEKGEEERGDY